MYLVSENKRLIRARGRMMNNSIYSKYKADLIKLWTPSIPKDWVTIQRYFNMDMEVWTYKDPTNLIKPILDVVQELGIIKNDKWLSMFYLKATQIKKTESESVKVKVW